MMDPRAAAAIAEMNAARESSQGIKVKLPASSQARHVLHGQAAGLELAAVIVGRHFGEIDPVLAQVILHWGALPDYQKAVIFEMLPRECVE